MIEAVNLFYISNFNVIGGTEQFIYQLAKKYHDIDITIVYKTGHYNQIKRLIKYARVIRYKPGMKFKCKKFFCNYETDIIDEVEAEEYIQIIHAMFKTNKITPRINPGIDRWIAVSNIASEEWNELTGYKPKVVRNPLTLDKPDTPLIFVSATRLTPEKGKDRMIKLGDLLNQHNVNYLWFIFTNDTQEIDNPNIVYVKPRLNVIDYLNKFKGNCYGVQLSDCEGDCYFTRECEALGIPLLVTPLDSFKEQNLIDGKNCYYLPFDMNNIDIEKIVNHVPSYDPYLRDDNWLDELINIKSNYEEGNMKVKLKCIKGYTDLQLNKDMTLGEEFIVDRERAEELLKNPHNIVELVEYVEEPKKVEKAVKPTKKVVKRK
jgi:glycosyltransferase involved in cell wall biosynthesis